jgi:hypothetical protein
LRDTTLATALADGQQQAHTDVDGGADGGTAGHRIQDLL